MPASIRGPSGCAWGLPQRNSATPSPWACRYQGARSSTSIRKSSTRVSGRGLFIGRPVSWWSAKGPWSALVMVATGRCWHSTRRCSTACSIRSAAYRRRLKSCSYASPSVAGAFTITFAPTPTLLCASRNWAHARRCCITMAVIWRRRCKPSLKLATPKPCMPRSAMRSPAPGWKSSACPAGIFISSFIRRGCCGHCRPPSCQTVRCAICC